MNKNTMTKKKMFIDRYQNKPKTDGGLLRGFVANVTSNGCFDAENR